MGLDLSDGRFGLSVSCKPLNVAYWPGVYSKVLFIHPWVLSIVRQKVFFTRSSGLKYGPRKFELMINCAICEDN